MSRDYDAIVIGAGQCGLAASYWLRARGAEHVVLDPGPPAGVWRRRWDSFALNTPNAWTLALPGLTYSGDDPDGFADRDTVVAYFATYLERYPPPLLAQRVTALSAAASGGFQMDTAEDRHHSRHVVIATGERQLPFVPNSAAGLAARLTQLHSEEYRNPAVLPPGGVLVVGSGSSGCQIAEDLRAAGREVYLSVGGSGRTPRHYRGLDINLWLNLGALEELFTRRRWRVYLSGKHGPRDLDLRHLAADGIHLLGRIAAVDGEWVRLQPDLHASLAAADACDADVRGCIDTFISATGYPAAPAEPAVPLPPFTPPLSAELHLERAGISSVIWCTGYLRDYGWVQLPVFDAHGAPLRARGISTHPGVYFPGLEGGSQHRSTLIHGVGQEARAIVAHMFGEPSSSAVGEE